MAEKSYSRQQYEAELAAGRARRTLNSSALIKPGSEDEIQANFFAWIDLHIDRFPDLALFHAIPNEGSRSKRDGARRKLMGRRAGVPDTNYPGVSNGYVGLWIEFKVPGGTLTPQQKVWIERLKNACHRVEVCTSWVDAANITIEYLGLPLEKL